MAVTRNKLYSILLLTSLAGYGWIIYQLAKSGSGAESSINTCLFKNITTIPCPSCGSTRSVIAIIQGHLQEALLWNPFGFLVVAIITVGPIWALIDLSKKSDSLYRFHLGIERFFKQKKFAIPAIILVLINWAWNIYKGL